MLRDDRQAGYRQGRHIGFHVPGGIRHPALVLVAVVPFFGGQAVGRGLAAGCGDLRPGAAAVLAVVPLIARRTRRRYGEGRGLARRHRHVCGMLRDDHGRRRLHRQGGIDAFALHPVFVAVLPIGRQLDLLHADRIAARRRPLGDGHGEDRQVRRRMVHLVEPADDAGGQGIIRGGDGDFAADAREGQALRHIRDKVDAVEVHGLGKRDGEGHRLRIVRVVSKLSPVQRRGDGHTVTVRGQRGDAQAEAEDDAEQQRDKPFIHNCSSIFYQSISSLLMSFRLSFAS